MSLPRLSLRLAALAFAGFGVALLVRPELMGMLGLELGRAAAFTEIRAFYGGLELGLALFFALASTRDAWLARRCSPRPRRSAGSCWRG